jgi:1,4-alpha-glucan branching enzyme
MTRFDALAGHMHTIADHTTSWRFDVNCPRADLVYLVTAMPDGSTHWTPMQRTIAGIWQTNLELHPGDYRFRYFISRGQSIISGGDEGLIVTPIDTPVPAMA